MIRFECPECNAKIKARPDKAGKITGCPKCKIMLRVPGDVEPPEQQPFVEPFSLKGDQLGCSLAEFKKKYHRSVSGRFAPWCSDSCSGEDNVSLMSKAYFNDAGIVNCRLDFPFEERITRDPITIAGAPTMNLWYQFVDQRLYQITALFDPEHTTSVQDALTAKYGEPSVGERKMQVWTNSVSSIVLTPGKRKGPRTSVPTVVLFMHDELAKLAQSRAPGPAVDDL